MKSRLRGLFSERNESGKMPNKKKKMNGRFLNRDALRAFSSTAVFNTPDFKQKKKIPEISNGSALGVKEKKGNVKRTLGRFYFLFRSWPSDCRAC